MSIISLNVCLEICHHTRHDSLSSFRRLKTEFYCTGLLSEVFFSSHFKKSLPHYDHVLSILLLQFSLFCIFFIKLHYIFYTKYFFWLIFMQSN